MITITKYPEPVVLAGNKVLVNATGSEMYSDQGRLSKLILGFTNGQTVTNNTDFTLSWGTKTITIKFRNKTVYAEDEFASTTNLGADWVNNFVVFLKSYYHLFTDFEIFITNTYTVTIQSRAKSADYTLAISGITPSTYLSITSGITSVIRSGYQFVFQLRDLVSNAILAEEAIAPDKYQKAVFDMSEYLWNILDSRRSVAPGFTFPSQATRIFERDSHVLPVWLFYAEKWDGVVHQLKTLNIDSNALMGGLSKLKEAEFKTYGTTFSQMLAEEMFFLTWQPVTKRTCLNAPERLFFKSATSGNRYLKARVYFYDTTTSDVSLGDEYFHSDSMYELDVSPAIFPSGASPIEKYEVWLEDGADPPVLKSEIRTYLIDFEFYRNEQHFIFRNSLGEYDTVRCTGRLKRQSEFDREVFTNDDNERQPLSNLLDATYIAETGSIPGDHARWLEDLMISKEVYWLLNSRAVPIIITSKKMNEITDDQRRFNLQFEFSVAGIDSFYSMPKAKPLDFGVVGNNNNNTIIDA